MFRDLTFTRVRARALVRRCGVSLVSLWSIPSFWSYGLRDERDERDGPSRCELPLYCRCCASKSGAGGLLTRGRASQCSEVTMIESDKQRVHDFWNNASCGEALYLSGDDRTAYQQQSDLRYQLEPFILDFADFRRYKG